MILHRALREYGEHREYSIGNCQLSIEYLLLIFLNVLIFIEEVSINLFDFV
jgi:hypothetical protein